MVKCKYCGQWYKTKEGLKFHTQLFHSNMIMNKEVEK